MRDVDGETKMRGKGRNKKTSIDILKLQERNRATMKVQL